MDGARAASYEPAGEEFPDRLRRARAGDRDALGKLLEPFYYVLKRDIRLRQGRSVVRDKCRDSDLLQDAMGQAVRDFKSFRGETPAELAAWLRRIMLNNLNDLIRYFNRGCRDAAREVPLEGRPGGQLADPGPSPDKVTVWREEAARFARALRELPAREQELLRLRFGERLDWDQIGVRLDWPADAARRACLRILREWGRAAERGSGPAS